MNLDGGTFARGLPACFSSFERRVVRFEMGLDLRRARALDQVDQDRCGRTILEREPQRDRQQSRKPVNPEDAGGLPVKIAQANQVELKQAETIAAWLWSVVLRSVVGDRPRWPSDLTLAVAAILAPAGLVGAGAFARSRRRAGGGRSMRRTRLPD